MNKYRRSLVTFVAFLFFTPLLAFAAIENFTGLVNIFLSLLRGLLPVLYGLALLVFFWGVAKFILRAGSETAREDAKNVIMWGVIALFVVTTIFGILSLLYSEFDFGAATGQVFGVPQLPTNR